MEKKNIVTWEELEEGEIYYIKRDIPYTVVYIAQYMGVKLESSIYDRINLKQFKCISKSENSRLILDKDNTFPLSRITVEQSCTIYKL